MNQVLQPPLPLASDHAFPTDQECIDHISGHAHQSAFAAGVPDPLRRDASLGHHHQSHHHQATGIPLSSIANRYRSEPSYHHSSATLSDTSGSISASPSSNASSSLAAFSFASPAAGSLYSHPFSSTGTFPYTYGTVPSTGRRSSIMTDPAPSAMLPPARSPAIPNPVSPSMGIPTTRDNYTTSTPGILRHPHTLSPRTHSDYSRYNLPETPRSVLSASMPLPTAYTTAGAISYAAQQPERSNDGPPFNPQENYHDIICEGAAVVPTIEAKIEKGFFLSLDQVWTCYRRNYFSLNVSYGLTPWVPNGCLYLSQGNSKPQEQIQSLAIFLAAAVDGSGGKSIELIQHTPKRDKGPQSAMKKELLAPTPPGKTHEHNSYGMNNYHPGGQTTGPQLPLQNEVEPTQQYSPTSHANNNYSHGFERIQFKSATANNGKRRAQQQFYHLIVELWANVQGVRDSEPRWIKVAARSSHPIVVRGRSPSHYQNEGPHNASASRGAGNGSMGGSGLHGLGSTGATSYGGYRNGLSGGGNSTMGGAIYRGNAYSLDPSPVGSHSVSSASSLSGGPVEGLVGNEHVVDEEDAKMIDSHPQYQYYPAPVYDTNSHKAAGAPFSMRDRRVKEELAGSATMGAGWQGGGCGRYQGLESSRVFYPDIHRTAPAGY